jgi:hypothetical protein
MTRVLPLPGPASTIATPLPHAAAFSCAWLRHEPDAWKEGGGGREEPATMGLNPGAKLIERVDV